MADIVLTTINHFNNWGKREEVQKLFFLERHIYMRSVINSFCLLEKQGKIQSSRMKHIWKYYEKVSRRILDKLADSNTISGIETIGMHDLVLDIINNRSGDTEKEKWHGKLLDSYNVRKTPGRMCRNWWDAQDDGYILRHLARHLRQSGN